MLHKTWTLKVDWKICKTRIRGELFRLIRNACVINCKQTCFCRTRSNSWMPKRVVRKIEGFVYMYPGRYCSLGRPIWVGEAGLCIVWTGAYLPVSTWSSLVMMVIYCTEKSPLNIFQVAKLWLFCIITCTCTFIKKKWNALTSTSMLTNSFLMYFLFGSKNVLETVFWLNNFFWTLSYLFFIFFCHKG